MKTGMTSGKQSGVAIVELALMLPILLVAVFGITELGRALYQYNVLVKSSRSAVRYLAQQDLANPPSGETADSLRSKAKSLAVCGALDCSAADAPPPLLPGLTTTQVSVCDYLACASHRSVLTGLGTVGLVSVTIGGSGSPVTFRSLMQKVEQEPFGWGITDFDFSAIRTTMASRYF